MKKVQLPVVGGIRKTIVIPDANLATTLQGYAGSTLTIAQLRTILGVTATTNTGNGNIGTPGKGAAPTQPPQVFQFMFGDDGGGGDSGSGPPGQQGAPGTNGATGSAGPAGPAVFIEAEPGEDGWPAVPGNPGVAGANGATGAPGPTGPAVWMIAEPGEDGPIGAPGATGPAGAGTSSPYNQTPDTHLTTPTFVANDEMDGAALDTLGTRFTGATAWAWLNQGATTFVFEQGAALFGNITDGLVHGVIQPISGGTWTYEVKCRIYVTAGGGTGVGFVVYNSGSTKLYNFLADNSNGPFACYAFNSPTSFNGVLFNATSYTNYTTDLLRDWQYMRVANDGTTLTFSTSWTGYEGTFQTLGSVALGTFISSVTHIGPSFNNNTAGGLGVIEHFRQIA